MYRVEYRTRTHWVFIGYFETREKALAFINVDKHMIKYRIIKEHDEA